MHQAEHNLGDHEDPMAGPTWMVSIVGVVLLIVIFLGLTALYYNFARTAEETAIVSRQAADFEALHAAQAAKLAGEPRWESRQAEGADEGVMEEHLVIPIDRAMQAVVREYGRN